jgi:PAS domain S-box-containing protein
MASLLYDRRPGPGRQGLGGTHHLWVAVAALAALAAIVLSQPIEAAPLKEIRRILILNEVGASYPAIAIINGGIQAALNDSPYRLEFYSEYMDAILFPDPAEQQEFRDFYLRKYHNRKPDVIITVGPAPIKFMEEVHQRAFPGVPIVFCLPNRGAPGSPTLDPDFTGVENDMAPAKTLEIALRLRPGTEHVVVVNGGISDFDKQLLAGVKQQLNAFTDHLDITYITELAMPDLLERLRHLPPQTLVLLTSIGEDAAGNRFKSSEAGPLVTAAAKTPVFSLFDVFLNHGEVGGYLSSFSEQGKVAGAMALRLLRGDKPQDIPRVRSVNAYMFDWRALQRWGLKVSELPPESIVLNHKPTIWESYKSYIIGGIAVILVEALLIFGLVWQRARRREVENQLRSTVELALESERRFRLVANTAPVMIWMSGPDKLCNYFNQPWLDFTGRSLEAELGNGWSEGIHPDDLKDCLGTYTLAFDLRESFRMEYRLRRHDAEYRWLLDIGVPRLSLDGSFAGYIGSCLDITDHKLAEEALANVGRRLIEAHEEERTWIARELHDDINQRIALLSVNLEQWAQHPPSSSVDVTNHIGDVLQDLGNLAEDIQALSHRLHSSKLEYLGLVAAAKGFCTELSEQKHVEIDFIHEGIPGSLPKEISLSLFRVLQEALQNAVKHSGARQFRVELRAASGEIQLTVNDRGVGFDRQNTINRHGLGLVSMQERTHLVGGQFSIQSEASRGTTISARVPLEVKKTKTSVASAGG